MTLTGRRKETMRGLKEYGEGVMTEGQGQSKDCGIQEGR